MSDPLAALFDRGRAVALAAGATVFLAGAPVRDVFFVAAGRAHLQRHTAQGARLVLQDAGPGAVLAEASAYAERYHCDAVAAAQTRLMALPRARLLDAVAADPELATVWAARLARGVHAARLRAEIRALPRVADRLDAWLGEAGAVPERGRWRDLAAELGVTPEALYRELARRRRLGGG